jgi:hypothetical protein
MAPPIIPDDPPSLPWPIDDDPPYDLDNLPVCPRHFCENPRHIHDGLLTDYCSYECRQLAKAAAMASSAYGRPTSPIPSHSPTRPRALPASSKPPPEGLMVVGGARSAAASGYLATPARSPKRLRASSNPSPPPPGSPSVVGGAHSAGSSAYLAEAHVDPSRVYPSREHPRENLQFHRNPSPPPGWIAPAAIIRPKLPNTISRRAYHAQRAFYLADQVGPIYMVPTAGGPTAPGGWGAPMMGTWSWAPAPLLNLPISPYFAPGVTHVWHPGVGRWYAMVDPAVALVQNETNEFVLAGVVLWPQQAVDEAVTPPRRYHSPPPGSPPEPSSP